MNEIYRDLPVTAACREALDIVHRFGSELVSHGNDCRVIFEGLALDPDCGLAQAYAAGLHLSAMTREGQAQAFPHLEAANAVEAFATERERMTVAAISAWHSGDTTRAIRLLRAVVEAWPHDLVAAKFCQVLELGKGDFEGMLRTSALAVAPEGRAGHALGLHAFAVEQAGDPELALRLARAAIELSPGKDPWAQHAAAHAMARMGQLVEGRAFLHAHATDWQRCSSFMLTHNWWHMALFSLELGDTQRALSAFDEHVWGVRKAHCQDQVNAISLLARLEMAGAHVGRRWADVCRYALLRADDAVSGFLDLHYLLALARGGRDDRAARLCEAIEDRHSGGVCGALARGVLAHARGDNVGAAVSIAPVRGRLEQVGGSNVQRALFEEIFVHNLAAMRFGSAGERRLRAA